MKTRYGTRDLSPGAAGIVVLVDALSDDDISSILRASGYQVIRCRSFAELIQARIPRPTCVLVVDNLPDAAAASVASYVTRRFECSAVLIGAGKGPSEGLTARQARVLEVLGRGVTSSATIAVILAWEEAKEVDREIEALMVAFDASDRRELASKARAYIRPPDPLGSRFELRWPTQRGQGRAAARVGPSLDVKRGLVDKLHGEGHVRPCVICCLGPSIPRVSLADEQFL